MLQLNFCLSLPLAGVSVFVSEAFSAYCMHVRAIQCPCALLGPQISFQVDIYRALNTCPYTFVHLVRLLFLALLFLACMYLRAA